MSIETESIPAFTVAVVNDRSPMAQMPEAMGRGFGRIMAVVSAQGAAPTGPPMTIYPEPMVEGGPVVFQSAIPVPPGVVGGGDVEIVEIPAGTVAVVIHEGPYGALGRTYARAMAELREAGLPPAGPPREIYLNDPGETPPERLLTRIELPVVAPA